MSMLSEAILTTKASPEVDRSDKHKQTRRFCSLKIMNTEGKTEIRSTRRSSILSSDLVSSNLELSDK